MDKKDLPIGVKIISVLYYIIGMYLSIAWILLMIIISPISRIPMAWTIGLILKGLYAIGELIGLPSGGLVSFIYILYGLPLIFIGRGLWKKQKWSRGAAIGIAIFVGLLSILSIMQSYSVSNLIKNIVILGMLVSVVTYLSFSAKVKFVFSEYKSH